MTKLLPVLGLLSFIGLAGISSEAVEKRASSYNHPTQKTTSSYSIKPSTSPYDVNQSTGIAKAKPKAAKKAKTSLLDQLEFEVGAGIEQMATSPAQSYMNTTNDSFKNGDYTFSVPINDWKDIPTPNANSTGAEASIKYKLANRISAGVSVGSGQSTLTSSYNDTYNLTDSYGTAIDNFDRKETIGINSTSVGIKGTYSLSKKFDVLASAKMDNYSVSGNVDYTMNRLDQAYTQWRTATYSGTGSGTSLEVGADWNITKNVSIGISAGSKTGKVECKGTDKASDSSNPGWYLYLDYNPTFNINSTFGKAELKIKF
jgi:hypothetical protein